MNLPLSYGLEIPPLSRLFDNMSESYKIFWFQAIVEQAAEGKTKLTYNEIIDRMIADAWYMVSEYRLNLGPSDTLEGTVHYVYKISGLKSGEKKETILQFLKECEDKELQKRKRSLTYHVPYQHFHRPFCPLVVCGS